MTCACFQTLTYEETLAQLEDEDYAEYTKMKDNLDQSIKKEKGTTAVALAEAARYARAQHAHALLKARAHGRPQ